MSKKEIILGLTLAIFCAIVIIIGTETWNFPYWLLGVLIGLSLLVLSITKSNWKIKDWYTFIISSLTISLVILIAYWMGWTINPKEKGLSKCKRYYLRVICNSNGINGVLCGNANPSY
ncbi:hypothetical protein [Thermococcus stetteri]|uniref:hypothetical protein n=1 Tax=Thermococcus stetteri TaxID=49900 RepID=UPI001AE750F5|nr:hypothetical protein [Thermococcus stetteri]MBP1912525.1 putative membrane protein [Thermococcus stetteri]